MPIFSTTDKGHAVFVVACDVDNAQTMVDASSRLVYIGSAPERAEQGVYALHPQWSQTVALPQT